jgi:alpha-aminoadipate carrier protein LysW
MGNMMETATCPDCGLLISLYWPQEGERIGCPTCGTDLEVIGLSPLELDWVYAEPERAWAELVTDDQLATETGFLPFKPGF